jgi:hypothetical protein
MARRRLVTHGLWLMQMDAAHSVLRRSCKTMQPARAAHEYAANALFDGD